VPACGFPCLLVYFHTLACAWTMPVSVRAHACPLGMLVPVTMLR
jgi:hypothetical protein